jgi:hypothetical protein
MQHVRTTGPDPVELDWQRSEGAPGSEIETRIRNGRLRTLRALSITIGLVLVTAGAAATVWLGTGSEGDEQFFSDIRSWTAAIKNVRQPSPSSERSEPSVPRHSEPVTPDVQPAWNIATTAYDPSRVSMIETGSLQSSMASPARRQDPLTVPEQRADDIAQNAKPAASRSRSPVARKVIGNTDANRARNTKWTATFFDR